MLTDTSIFNRICPIWKLREFGLWGIPSLSNREYLVL
uniref:Uncharacterized protein n=1 Tax=Rhizophora mucronata TaxID=61149 RepID=A0A2P2N0B8_RHIMU